MDTREQFYDQSKRAKKLGPLGVWRTPGFGDTETVLTAVQSKEFVSAMDAAYDSEAGYSIANLGGQKVLFIAGVASQKELVDATSWQWTPAAKQQYAIDRAKRFDELAEMNGIDVVVGHSRGAAVAAHMKAPVKKLAVDGYMAATSGDNAGNQIYNLHSSGLFDRLIARGGWNNHRVKGRGGHSIYRQKGVVPVKSNLPRLYAGDKYAVTSKRTSSRYQHDAYSAMRGNSQLPFKRLGQGMFAQGLAGKVMEGVLPLSEYVAIKKGQWEAGMEKKAKRKKKYWGDYGSEFN